MVYGSSSKIVLLAQMRRQRRSSFFNSCLPKMGGSQRRSIIIANCKTCETPFISVASNGGTDEGRKGQNSNHRHFIKLWCEHCRIRIDAHEERTEVGSKTYHPDCYAELFSAIPKRSEERRVGTACRSRYGPLPE